MEVKGDFIVNCYVDFMFKTFLNNLHDFPCNENNFIFIIPRKSLKGLQKGRKLTRNFGFAIISRTAMFASTSDIVWLANAIVFCGTIMVCVARDSKTKSRKLVNMRSPCTVPEI